MAPRLPFNPSVVALVAEAKKQGCDYRIVRGNPVLIKTVDGAVRFASLMSIRDHDCVPQAFVEYVTRWLELEEITHEAEPVAVNPSWKPTDSEQT